MERRKFIRNAVFGVAAISFSPLSFAGSRGKKCKEEVCREAWNNLRLLTGPAFDYVHPQKGIPKVLLYGDSISIGYTPIVRNSLKGRADVFRTYRNGGASQHLIPGTEEMQKTMFQPHLKNGWDFTWDVIHFNVGLHDLKYLNNGKLDKENGKQVSSVEEYKTKLNAVCSYLQKEFPQAKLIFATTTPVPEGAAGRYAGDSVRYNKAALQVLANYPAIAINDLYAFTKPNLEAWAIKPGDVHYNDLGKTEQGKEVARIIEQNL
ncbi:SGNH/GDSL hydrolase family protein [uncultured Draconibacterium sp.]|uniref:SGNH/GDSL hydrolase family protein n=1 Tax=uncultured Draconibacterium sp. TaxID=1573823 RepID=UPI0025FADE4E|nr:SGNH/GDSL hydrolase family protein [uncultured Draconibacterium sp.]